MCPCAERRGRGESDRAMNWLGKTMAGRFETPLHFSDGHIAHGQRATRLRQDGPNRCPDAERGGAGQGHRLYVKIQIVGTHEDCVQQIAELQRVTGNGHRGHRNSRLAAFHMSERKRTMSFREPRVPCCKMMVPSPPQAPVRAKALRIRSVRAGIKRPPSVSLPNYPRARSEGHASS